MLIKTLVVLNPNSSKIKMCDRPVSGSRKACKLENSAYVVILTLGEPVAFPGKTVSRSDEVAERIEVVRNIGRRFSRRIHGQSFRTIHDSFLRGPHILGKLFRHMVKL